MTKECIAQSPLHNNSAGGGSGGSERHPSGSGSGPPSGPPSLSSSQSESSMMDVDVVNSGHQTLEFFEMCSNLITTLAK